ncbi:MAG: prolipoprotein diacylglyceryl transferase [Anaerolineales bacterium]|nr:prolipoprotein diacylglyceryl transferase [Anaerolineales bacterium]
MDPILFSFNIGDITLAVRWYGLLVGLGIFIAAWVAAIEVKRCGEDEDHLWDAMLILVIAGIIGARLWYVVNSIAGGSKYYLENPIQIINTPAGGLHFYGGILFGAIAFIWYARKHKLDLWLFFDAVGPALLLGQAIARPANFINQELYGPPTTLPWGIKIDAIHRLAPFNDLVLYPESTLFHPTFSYEIIWNVLAAALLVWLARRYAEIMKPGAVFLGWLVLAGVGRVIIETWRPDQPLLPGTGLSYTRLVAGLMALAGVVGLLGRYRIINWPFFRKWEESYQISEKGLAKAAEIEKGEIAGGTVE